MPTPVKTTAPQTGSVSPDSWLAEISDLVLASGQVPYEEGQRFVHVDEAEFNKARSSAFDPQDPVNNMIMLYASTRTYENVAKHLLRKNSPHLLAVYFELVDATKEK